MAYTQADLDKLQKAIASGARSVEYNDSHKVEYRSLNEMQQIAKQIKRQLAGKSGKKRTRLAVFSNGY